VVRETDGCCARERRSTVVKSVIFVCVVCEEDKRESFGDRSELARKRLQLWVCQGVTL